MKIFECEIFGVKIIYPSIHEDNRGFFFESYHKQRYKDLAEISAEFVQDNHSRSEYGVLRGLHFQKKSSGKINKSNKRSRI